MGTSNQPSHQTIMKTLIVLFCNIFLLNHSSSMQIINKAEIMKRVDVYSTAGERNIIKDFSVLHRPTDVSKLLSTIKLIRNPHLVYIKADDHFVPAIPDARSDFSAFSSITPIDDYNTYNILENYDNDDTDHYRDDAYNYDNGDDYNGDYTYNYDWAGYWSHY